MIPAPTASWVEIKVSSFPRRTTLPARGGTRPARQLKSSGCPFPSAPAIPTTSPLCSVKLTGPKGKGGSVRVMPLALPARDYPTERGTISTGHGWLTLRQPRAGRRTWLPVLFSWDPSRARRPLSWRVLTVTERTREIGIRMAMGARSRDILWQFLVESVVLSSVGGLIGLGLGIGASVGITQIINSITQGTKWPVVISIPAAIVAILFAAAVGIFFGYYPARRASKLDPIDALRYE